MQKYVVGLLFDTTMENVVLIKKNKPEWQKGKLNGVGGKIMDGEYPLVAMSREFKEETGKEVTGWDLFLTLRDTHDMYNVSFFRAFSEELDVKTMEEEDVLVVPLSKLQYFILLIPNLRWIIPLALDLEMSIATVVTDYLKG